MPSTVSPDSDFTAIETQVRDALRRCSAPTIDAALIYRKTGDVTQLPAVIFGIVERYVDPALRPQLTSAGVEDLRVVEDLGLDSLTIMEVVMLVEEVVLVTISNNDLRELRTLGDIKTFVDCRARGVEPPKPPQRFAAEAILALMPIQPPFLFLNEATIAPAQATATYKITGEEFFLAGHFKGNPVMPASLMLEALGQLGVFHLLSGLVAEPGKRVDPASIFFASTDGVRCSRVCRPGDVLSLTLKPKRIKAPLVTFEGSIRVEKEKAVIAEEITLTFALVDEVAPTDTVSPPPASGEATAATA
jgi:3-hydroxyacyl-[acyl-carrier-protein] dehydratase